MQQFVYVIQSASGLVKVGVSANPERRRAALQTQSGFAVDLVLTKGPFNAAGRVESAVHRLLSRDRGYGEWFCCPTAVAVAAVERAISEFRDDDDSSPEDLHEHMADVSKWIAGKALEPANMAVQVAAEAVERYFALLNRYRALERDFQDACKVIEAYVAEADASVDLAQSDLARVKALESQLQPSLFIH